LDALTVKEEVVHSLREDCDEGGTGDAEGLDVDEGEVCAILDVGRVGADLRMFFVVRIMFCLSL
jgi:hypothetical protein